MFKKTQPHKIDNWYSYLKYQEKLFYNHGKYKLYINEVINEATNVISGIKKKKIKIMDLGSGNGSLLNKIIINLKNNNFDLSKLYVYAVDNSNESLKDNYRKNSVFLKIETLNINLNNNFPNINNIDLILCFNTLWALDRPIFTLEKMKKNIVTDGIIFLTIPCKVKNSIVIFIKELDLYLFFKIIINFTYFLKLLHYQKNLIGKKLISFKFNDLFNFIQHNFHINKEFDLFYSTIKLIVIKNK
ncbi:MAG: methyltransferase domain-containing protein [Patescibacteria group bacterium]|nr:methyltransferase domain-containing protein [Patescibacteria group bacterium]